MGPADGGATEWAADAVRGGLPGSKDIWEQLQRLRGPPEGRMDAVSFVSTRMRQMAALKTGSTPRRWKLLSEVAGAPTLTIEQWRTAHKLLREPTVMAAVTPVSRGRRTSWRYGCIEDWWGQPRRWEEGIATGVCECVRGGRCELQNGERLDEERYQTCVDKLADGRFQPGNWRRAADTRAAGEGEGEGEVRDTTVHCLCGERSATPLGRASHTLGGAGFRRKETRPPTGRARACWRGVAPAG